MADAVSCSPYSPFFDHCSSILFGNGGTTPYIEVVGRLGSYIDVDNPSQISWVYADTAVSEVASGSLQTGQLHSTDWAKEVYYDADSLTINARDSFTLSGAPGVVSITARFRVDGNAILPAVDSSILTDGGQANLILCGPGGSYACGGDTFNLSYGPPFPGYSGPIYSQYNTAQHYLERTWTWDQQVGVPFNVFYSMQIQVYSGSTIDLSHTGTLDFILPGDYEVTSAGGYSSLVASGVPEPGTWVLMALGLAAAGLRKARQRGRGPATREHRIG
jgi:hypothetical protein